MTKIWTEGKTEKFRYDLKKKIKISEVSEFSILLYTQNGKLGNLGKFYFPSTFSSIWRLNKESMKISEVSEFLIWPYEQNWKLGNLGNFTFALNFDWFDCI